MYVFNKYFVSYETDLDVYMRFAKLSLKIKIYANSLLSHIWFFAKYIIEACICWIG